MRRFHFWWKSTLVFGLLLSPLSWAGVNPSLAVVGDLLFSGPYAQQSGVNMNFDGRQGLGGGLLLGFTINDSFGLEIGATYVNKTFQQQNYQSSLPGQGSVTATESTGVFQLPVLLKFYPLKIVSVGLGAYYSQALGNWSISYDNGSGGTQTDSVSYSSRNLSGSDFGAVLSVGVELPLTDLLSVMGDLRLTQSLTSSATQNSSSWQYRDIHILAGVKFNFGS